MAKSYKTYNGSKLEYCATEEGNYTQVKGLKTTPDIGGEPNKIDTTDLDNTEYETQMNGLKPAQAYNFEFNMEDPAAQANMNLISNLEDNKTISYWKYTLSNGIIIKFRSDVKTTIAGGSSGDIIGFTAHLSPIEEPTVTIPTGE